MGSASTLRMARPNPARRGDPGHYPARHHGGGARSDPSSADGWRAAAADDHLRRSYTEHDFDDAAWHPVAVPGHWRSSPAFADSDGPLLYRCRFEADRAGRRRRRAWLTFDGLFYQGDVWLDGGYLGDTEGYFLPHTFEVTDALRDRREHALAVEVTCSPQRGTARRSATSPARSRRRLPRSRAGTPAASGGRSG